MCLLCTAYEPESIGHLLFRCTALEEYRVTSWFSIVNTCPAALRMDIANMTDNHLAQFLLCGLNDSFTMEWVDLFRSIVVHISALYDKRCKLVNAK